MADEKPARPDAKTIASIVAGLAILGGGGGFGGYALTVREGNSEKGAKPDDDRVSRLEKRIERLEEQQNAAAGRVTCLICRAHPELTCLECSP